MKVFIIILVAIIAVAGLLIINGKTLEQANDEATNNLITDAISGDELDSGNGISNNKKENDGILKSIEDIDLQDEDGKGRNYSFRYNDEKYEAIFVKDTWKIYDSYKIINRADMAIICEALINVHPIPSKDRESFREVEDLVYEWHQHNIAYRFLAEDNAWKKSAKDVDLDPEDQGRNIQEIYEARTGKKFDIKDF